MRYMHLALPAAALLASLVADRSFALEARYIDDRSDPSAIIQSFYNAVNRKEYARAWDYYGEEKPGADVEAFAKGYEDTAEVNVITGNVAMEGAAGSTFYYLPVSIASFAPDGSEQVFSGCYTLRLANPSIQEPPFRPLHIEKGALKPSRVSLNEALPASCPDAPPPEATDTILAKAKARFAEAYADCDRQLPGADPAQAAVEQYTIPFRYSTDGDEQPERQARLFRFYCGAGAYNENHVYYQYDQDGGLRQLQFATPELDIRYENDDTDGKLESVEIIGYTADDMLVNSAYDQSAQTITSAPKWRGVGDASAHGTWIFRNGRFTLVQYDVDASYDGEINPETVLDFHTAP
ncbi:MAG: DUF1176 domain-containing protein [Hyphomicrobiales bacterium]|nr:DUF1176 domain-containing protein [Hyphomicrobiales bacterium]